MPTLSSDLQKRLDVGLASTAAGAELGAILTATALQKAITALDDTDTLLFTITVPNAICGASLLVRITGTLGDGDSTDSTMYLIAVSRIAGAAAKAVKGTKFGTAATAGATANAVVIVDTVPAVGGGVTADNTFAIVAKCTRSAGSATNHVITAAISLLGATGGVTIA